MKRMHRSEITSLGVANIIRAWLRNRRTMRHLTHMTYCGDQVELRVYSAKSYRTASELIASQWGDDASLRLV
jgi:hypothetical protein